MADLQGILVRIWIQFLSTLISMLFLTYLMIMRLIKGKKFLQINPRSIPPPLLSNPKLGNHSYLSLKGQGIKLHYVEKGDKNNPLIVCLHGFPECWISWRNQLEHLSEKYWVVAVDMRGYGDSDKPSGIASYDVKHLVEDMRQFVLALGKEKCTLMAHDWGAVVAWYLIMKSPELFSNHISFNGPHPKAFTLVRQSSWEQTFKSWYMVFFQTPWVPELLIGSNDLALFDKGFGGKQGLPDDVREVYKYYYSKQGALTPPINYYRANNIGADSHTFPKVTVPTLIVWGTDDVALNREMAILATKECENAVLEFVEGAQHWVPQEQPELANKLVLDYLDSATS